MKKFTKIMTALAVIGCSACVAAFAGCSKDSSYTGEYQYTASGTNYGIKVSVTVDSDNVITSVKKVDSDYVDVTEALPDYGWTQENVDNWNNNLDALLKSYEGKTVEEVLALTVTVSESGAPSTDSEELGGLIITGATMGSGRLLLAVQDALKDLK